MSNRTRAVSILALLATVAACASLQHGPAAPPVSISTGASQAPVEASLYRIDSSTSEVHILVYRGGPLARLGHNHVMLSREVTGEVWLADAIERSAFTLHMPVETLIIDDPQARGSEGPDFPIEVPDDAKQGTRKNMLSAAVLDAAQYRTVELRSIAISGTRTAPQLTLAVTIKDQTREVNVPISVRYEQNRLLATGEFAAKQTDFGIQPFSVGLGALQVVDELRIKFKVSATRVDG
jgi:polyisoprenoid-binding protein YceI